MVKRVIRSCEFREGYTFVVLDDGLMDPVRCQKLIGEVNALIENGTRRLLIDLSFVVRFSSETIGRIAGIGKKLKQMQADHERALEAETPGQPKTRVAGLTVVGPETGIVGEMAKMHLSMIFQIFFTHEEAEAYA